MGAGRVNRGARVFSQTVLDWARSYAAPRRSADGRARLVDTTMLYAPRSGGVKRYLSAKRAWLAAQRPQVKHTLVVPGPRDAYDGAGRLSIYAAPLPFGDGDRWPASKTALQKRLLSQTST